jgi:hypothetical protein
MQLKHSYFNSDYATIIWAMVHNLNSCFGWYLLVEAHSGLLDQFVSYEENEVFSSQCYKFFYGRIL